MLSEGVVLQKLRNLDPYSFEKLLAEIWERKGYSTKVRQTSGDRGIDVEAKDSSNLELIQAKRYGEDNRIGSQTVREYATLYQQVNTATKVVIVSTGYFTKEANQLAEDLSVELINGEELFHILNEDFPDLAIDYLIEVNTSESKEEQPTNPFNNPIQFDKISPNQGYFDGCRAPGCGGNLWFGKKYSTIFLKCDQCGETWQEVKQKTGLLERFLSSSRDSAKVKKWKPGDGV